MYHRNFGGVTVSQLDEMCCKVLCNIIKKYCKTTTFFFLIQFDVYSPRRHVLTAAHCHLGGNLRRPVVAAGQGGSGPPRPLLVRLGDADLVRL